MSVITENKMKKSKIVEVPFWLLLVMLGVIGFSIGHYARDLILYFFK